MTKPTDTRRASREFAFEALGAEHIARQAARRAAQVRAKHAERESLQRLARALQEQE